ncbi:histone-fold-containing protein [Auriculariales sp. MPI-PUGE-AT-0066]|nr:histone-fold-containing protein [Auriculariales sp. MPI-PUGE-AT-0066]
MSPPTASGEPFVHSGDTLDGFLRSFWQRQVDTAEHEASAPSSSKDNHAHASLPLARIKKVMKTDPDVKQMIAADAPILFAKACEIFIAEVTARAFIVADADKRRTISKTDISKALGKTDQFDFLIDIVPREGEPAPKNNKRAKKEEEAFRQRAGADAVAHPDDIEVMAHGPALDGDPDLTGAAPTSAIQQPSGPVPVSAGPQTQINSMPVSDMGLFDHFLNPDI